MDYEMDHVNVFEAWECFQTDLQLLPNRDCKFRSLSNSIPRGVEGDDHEGNRRGEEERGHLPTSQNF